MIRIFSNATQIAARFRERAARLTAAAEKGLKRVAAAIDRAQVERLSGSNKAAPGTYPVPARTGHLRQSHFFTVERANLAFVGNTAKYAHAIHEGRGSSAKHGRRPFLDDAVEAVDAAELFAIDIEREVIA